MTYFEDLTPYSYSEWPDPMVNVGWLGRGHDFATGAADSAVVSALIGLAVHPKNMMRGLHNCQFCDVESPISVSEPNSAKRVFLGSGEIHIQDESGQIFSAPTLIVHYITAHSYRPPTIFTSAVIAQQHLDL